MEEKKNKVPAGKRISSVSEEALREQKYPLEDAALKTAAQYFGEEFLPYLGIKERVKYIAPTEGVHLEIRKLYQDFNYEMEDGTVLSVLLLQEY